MLGGLPKSAQFSRMKLERRVTVTREEEEEHKNFLRTWNLLYTLSISLLVIVGVATIVLSLIVALFHSDIWRPQLKFKRGAVATDSPEMSRVGATILQRGGNAVDAAVASTLCLGVLRPFASGIGGGGFAMLHLRRNGQSSEEEQQAPTREWEDVFVDFREVAPGTATVDMFKGAEAKSEKGALSSCVPSEIAGLEAIHKRYGKMPWKRLFEPAINLASFGFNVEPLMQQRLIDIEQDVFAFEELRNQFTKQGLSGKQVLVQEGHHIKRLKLARTLQLIAEQGASAMYNCTSSDLCKSIVREIREQGGIITEQDMEKYQVKFAAPHRQLIDYSFFSDGTKQFEFLTSPVPSSGPVIALMARVFEQKRKELTNIENVELNHLMIECLKYGFANRMLLGDNATRSADGQMYQLEYAQKIARNISLTRTFGWPHYLKSYEALDKTGTTHLTIIDKELNTVVLTSGINWSFGSKIILPGSGILMNNLMADFTIDPDKPNKFGIPPSKANLIEPSKRPMSSMSPTIVLNRDTLRTKLAIGGSGGSTIISSVWQVMQEILLLKRTLSPKQAVDEHRFHVEVGKDSVFIEPGFDEDLVNGLRTKGHVFDSFNKTLPDGHKVGNVQVIQVIDKHNQDFELWPASDIRKNGRAAGY